MFRLFVCVAFALALIGCGSQQLPTTSSGAASSISAQAASPLTVPVRATSSTRWQIDGDSRPANWSRASDGDCGSLTFPTDSSVNFDLKKDGIACKRDQLNPWGGDIWWQLTPGQVYTWKFTTVTHMGVDRMHYADRLVFQIHQGNPGSGGCPMSPFTGLSIPTSGGGVQTWQLRNDGDKAEIAYTEGGTDTWEIQAKIANNGTGWTKMYHNGTLKVNNTGPNYPPNCGAPFFNFGPYEWLWSNPHIHDPLSEVGILFKNMTVTSP